MGTAFTWYIDTHIGKTPIYIKFLKIKNIFNILNIFNIFKDIKISLKNLKDIRSLSCAYCGFYSFPTVSILTPAKPFEHSYWCFCAVLCFIEDSQLLVLFMCVKTASLFTDRENDN